MKPYEWQLAELRKAQAEGWQRYLRKLASGIRSQVRRALLARDKTPDRYKAAIGCTYRELAIHIEKQFQPGMTWENMGEWHVDHVVPVAHFLETDPEGVAWNHYTNLQPLWAKDNLSKGAKR
jgi:hypothetical protein